MGAGSSSKHSTRGVIDLIRNHQFNILSFRACFRLIIFFCVFGVLLAVNISAQTLETLAEQIRSGNSEQKRSALFEIRNRQKEEASRIAVPALKDSSDIVRATAAFSVIYLPKEEA